MKIALLTDGIQPYVTGGMQKHSYFIAKYLAAKGIEVDLYHNWENKEFDVYSLDIFTPEERENIRSFVIDFPPPGKLPGHYLRRSYRYSERVYETFHSQSEVDFIYVKGFAGWKLLEEKKKGVQFPPIGIKFHGLNMFQKPPSFKGRLEQWMFRPPVQFNMQQADCVFSYGGKITRITEKAGVERKKIIEIPTGIEQDQIAKIPGKTAGKRKFLFIGRYERLKGVEELSKAIEILEKKNDFEFHFVGPISEKLQLNSPKVKYWGMLSDTAMVREVINSVDVLVCPSYSEGMPNVIIEAMASGLVVIATDVGAINYLVGPQNGWLLPKCSVHEITAAMRSAIDANKDTIDKMKQASLNFAETNLKWEKIVEVLIHEVQALTK